MNETQRLINKVNAINLANTLAMEVYKQLAPIFEPLVGTQIEKVTGGLFQKIKNILPEFQYSTKVQITRHVSNYSLAWNVRVCESAGDEVIYYDTMVYIGELRNCVLEKITPPYTHRTDYTVEEVQAKRQALKEADKALDKARSALHPFGENDWR